MTFAASIAHRKRHPVSSGDSQIVLLVGVDAAPLVPQLHGKADQSCPWSRNNAAAADESTSPLIATAIFIGVLLTRSKYKEWKVVGTNHERQIRTLFSTKLWATRNSGGGIKGVKMFNRIRILVYYLVKEGFL